MTLPVDVSADGTVHLSSEVVCDGFYRGAEIRVQTHIHYDHLSSFNTSKGFQTILLTPASRRLLCAEENADIPYRSNIKAIEPNTEHNYEDSRIELIPSGHMLGAVQVKVARSDGLAVGYSSDFSWPLPRVIDVDVLVLDSTYGNPTSVREYSQAECENQFIGLINDLLQNGPVYLYSHRGTLQRALQLIDGQFNVPIMASTQTSKRIDIFREFGYPIGEITRIDNPSTAVDSNSSYIRVFGTGDKKPIDTDQASVVKLSAYFTRPSDPIVEYSPQSYGVALSDHADFTQTLEYVRATGAELVITDNARGGNAIELAHQLEEALDIQARPSTNQHSRNWGSLPRRKYTSRLIT